MPEQIFVSGHDQPDDQQKQQNHNIYSHSFCILSNSSEFWRACLSFPYLGLQTMGVVI